MIKTLEALIKAHGREQLNRINQGIDIKDLLNKKIKDLKDTDIKVINIALRDINKRLLKIEKQLTKKKVVSKPFNWKEIFKFK